MHAILVILAALAATAGATAAEPQTIRLWEGDAPAARGAADHDVPVLTWWAAERAKGAAGPVAAFVICPGGGYGGLADHEGSGYAQWLNSLGIDAGVLRYRLGSKGYRHPVMLGDAARAMRMVRHEGARLGIDPHRLGMIGSSAGGHLALTLLTHGDDGDPNAADPVDRQPSRADIGVLCYPVASMAAEWTHAGSRQNLLGDAPTAEVVRDLSGELMPAERIAGMPPVFIFHTHEDAAVKLEPILQLALRLKEAGRPYALHVYEKGPHGVGLGVKPYDPTKLHPWTAECRRWLAAHGYTPAPADPKAPH
ncbi:MAG: alpha/beta hydrolase [Planctomycetia bacterium]